ncbi:MAG: right-handed parallel beta-helix repeat-containing protein [Deltaproteobacteria bacterium]|nr:right-handed parallel beta-helix repeat-containing protein [Deltaproteobacteria bacterium]
MSHPLLLSTGAALAAGLTVVVFAGPAQAADLYVATDGDDNQSGSLDQPFGTIAHAVDQAQNGDVVHLRGGTYRLMDENTDAIHITLDGATETSFLTLQAYEGEEPILLGSLSTEGQTWEDAGGGLYRLPATFLHRDPTGMFSGEQRIEHQMKDVSGTRSHADIAALVNPGEWTKADDGGLGCPSDNAGCFIYLRPFDGEDPTQTTYELSQRKLFYTTGVSYLTVRGLTVRYTQNSAFSFEGGRGQLVEDCVLGHNSNGNDNAYSVFVSYGGGVTIRNNRAFDSKYWGGFSNSKGITLMDMDPDDPSLVEGNEVHDIIGQGITTKSGVANIVVQRNYVHDVGVGIEPPGPRCHWTNSDCELGDPEYYPGGGWEIRENALVRCDHGVSMRTLAEAEGGIPNRIYNNVFFDNGSSGIDLRLANTGTVIANNIFRSNPRGVFLNHGNSGDTIAVDLFWPVFEAHHNLFSDNDDDYLFRPDWTGPGGSGTGYTLADIQAVSDHEEGSLTGDPAFVDEATPDFHLQDGSPASEAGDGSFYGVQAVDMGRYPGVEGGAGGTGGSGGSASGGGGSGGAPDTALPTEDDSGCGCRLPRSAPRHGHWLTLLGGMALLASRRLRRR